MIGANARAAYKPDGDKVSGVDLFWLPYPGDGRAGREHAVPVIAQYLGCGVEMISLETGPGGRPRLARPRSPVDFNLAHAGGRMVLALGSGRFGVDLEALGRPRDHLALARHQLDGDELALVESAPEERRARAFLALWTAKEALAKALGRGLDAFGEIRLARAPDESLKPTRLPDEAGDPASWQVRHFEPERGYLAALALDLAT